MAIYGAFSNIYDSAMDNIPYEEWAEQIREVLAKRIPDGAIVCEMGCGTGELTMRLSKFGYDMIGIDLSEEMLDVAKEKQYEAMGIDLDGDFDPDALSDPPILYLNQDIREMELYGTVGACICSCDTLNYLSNTDELTKVFRLVNNYLDRDGVFLFDVKTEHFYREICGNRTRVEEDEHSTLIWDNEYDSEEKKNYYRLTLFVEEPSGMFRRDREEHIQTMFSREEIERCLSDAGLRLEAVYSGYTKNEANEACDERLVFVCREGFQEGKLY